ncbi:MAG: hypothetical protein ACC645_19030 [Pirellulales bacterium]
MQSQGVPRTFARTTCALLVLTVHLATIIAGAAERKAAIAVSGHPQLFLDDYLLAEMHNVTRVLQQPTKHSDNPLPFEPEYAWERSRMSPGSVLYDGNRKMFRMWYPVLMDKSKYADNFGVVCYAESSDGVHWKKPMMRLHDFEGQMPTNIVSKGPSGKDSECLFPSVIMTPHDPSRLYKMLFTHRRTPDNPSHYGLHVACSKDGLHWTEPKLIFQGKCDNPPSLVWSPPLEHYFGFCRAQDSHPDMVGHIRSTGILTSTDFDRWTPRKKVVLTDQRDGYPFVQFHHLMVTQYGDVMIGMADVMHIMGNDNKTSTEDVQLICSRDGWNWHRVADRAVFIPNGPGGYDREMVSPRSAFVLADDVLHIFYLGSPSGQGRQKRTADASNDRRERGGMCLATLPAERFVGLVPSSPGKEGVVRTRPLITSGRHLLLNAELADTSDIEVELLDEKGSVLSHFGGAESRLIVHDRLRYRVVWKNGGREVSLGEAAVNRPVALRFVLRAGALFAFQSIE